MSYKAGSVYVDAELRDKKFKAGMKGLGKSVALGAAAIGTAFAVGMTVAIKKADEFQKSMSNVSTVIDTSVISTQDLTKSLLRLDPALGGTTELTDGLYQAFSAGARDAEEAMEITTNSAMFAKAALTDTATAVDVLTTATNAYGADVMDTTTAADIFFTTIKEGKITGEQLSATIGQSIPLFASMNIGLDELGAGLAAMTKQGIASSEATTQMNAMVNAFIKPSAEMSAALLEIGYSSGSAFIEAEGLSGALEFLEGATGGSKDEMAKLVPNIRGLKGVMALTGQGGKIFNEVMIEMADSAGANQEAFDKQEKTFESLKNSMGKTQIIIGNIGKAFVDEIADGATTANEAMNEFLMSGRAAEIFGQVIGTVAAAFSGVVQFTKPIVDTIGSALGEIFTTIGDVMQDLTGESDKASASFNVLGIVSQSISFGISLVSSVIQSSIEVFGSWIGAITETGKAVGTLFKLMSKDVTWDDVKDQFATAGDAFKTLGADYVGAFVDLYKTGAEEIKNFGAESEAIATNIETSVTSTYQNVETMFISTWDRLITGQEDANDELSDNQEESNDEREDEEEETAGNIINTWKDAWAALKTGDSEMYDTMIGELEGYTSTATKIYDDTFGAFLSTADMFLQNRADQEDAAYNASLEALNSNFANETISQSEYDLQKEQLETDHAKKMNAIQEKQFKANKASRISQVWIDAASSIMGWWAAAPQLGILAGPIVAGIMTGVTLGAATAQSIAIGQQNFVPAFAAGGTMRGSGTARVNEQGGEIQRLGDGTLIIPNDISREMAGGAGGTTINVSFAGANITDNVSLDRIVERVSRQLGRQMRAAS